MNVSTIIIAIIAVAFAIAAFNLYLGVKAQKRLVQAGKNLNEVLKARIMQLEQDLK